MYSTNYIARYEERSMNAPRKVIFLLLVITFMKTEMISGATDTINASQSIRDGETMVSSGGMFELGFFSPPNSNNRYVGMWYKKISVKTIVWVANRQTPLTTKTGVFKVIEPGILVILNDTNSIAWSSGNTSRSVKTPIAQLLDSGNLVVRDLNEENFVWQSFDYPTDTYLPGMKFGRNYVTGIETYFSSWKTAEDPAPGEFGYHMDPTGYPQVVLRKGTTQITRFGPWNGIYFSGFPDIRKAPTATYNLTLVMNKNEVYYQEHTIDTSVVRRATLNQIGVVQRWIWVDRTQEWVTYLNVPADNCDTYNICGGFGICHIENAPSCSCLDKFKPKDPEGWIKSDWSDGCIHRKNLTCKEDIFLKYSRIKPPDARTAWFNEGMTLEECKKECSRNCSCMAYTQLDLSNKSGCLIWFEDLVDIRALSADGQDIYIRMASSEADSKEKKREILVASLIIATGMILLGLSIIIFCKRKNNSMIRNEGQYNESDHKESALPLLDLSTIQKATNYFSNANKLGEGGFGPVYKGMLEEGQEIAVKRLSRTSTQGLDEFKNEVIFISKLQHRNLVRVIGCCIQEEENMVVYEYMPNKSLDMMIFDQTTVSLDWSKRFHIINGIARGLVYLHQDSRLRIIHRDLKASNVLLDSDMNPKISDFGMARSFVGGEIEAKTRRVVGTYGYMSPEYAVDGIFSAKSDVFSFGVLVLEIVSGKRNRGFSHSNHHLNLLGHAWTLYKEERLIELVDTCMDVSYDISEVLRSIHVGLLCVQQNPEDRPNMSSVVLMLGNEGVLPEAKHPGFYTEREPAISQSSTNTNATTSANEVTITLLAAR